MILSINFVTTNNATVQQLSTYFTPKLADFRCPGITFVVDVSGTCDAFLETVADSGALIDTTSEPTGTEIRTFFNMWPV